MSLLNDALRDLDQRRQGEAAASPIPPGLQDRGNSPLLIWLLAAALVLAVLLAFWFWWSGVSAEPTPVAPEQVPAITVAPIARTPNPEISPIAEPVPERGEQAAAQDPASATATATPAETSPAAREEPTASPEPAVADTPPAREPQTPVSEPEPEPEPETTAAEPAPAPTTAVRSQAPAPGADNDASSVRQLSPQQQEQRAAEAISQQLSRGDVQGATRAAESRLLLDPEAPETRAVMARYWLRQQDLRQAREWLPGSIAQAYPELRLLRARTELMAQQPEQALGWLTRSLPPVSTHSRYHVTLAALQQQLGQHQEAAMTWAALIEYDDARADWWAGLGIALEGQGRQDSARRAFVQASELPGLSQALQNYVQQRLSQPTSTPGGR